MASDNAGYDCSALRRHTNLTRLLKPLPVGTVDDINLRQRKVVRFKHLQQSLGSIVTQQRFSHQQICVFKVVPPVGPDLPLASNVPNVEFEPLRLDTFDVKALE